MRRGTVVVASLGGLAAGVWAWLRRTRPQPALAERPEPAAGEAARSAESSREETTAYERAGEAEAEDRLAVADRLRADPLTEQLETPPDEAA
jgi:hypothetical protein